MAFIESLYIRFANKLNIFANDASHTVTGGGVIFPLAYFIGDLLFTDDGFIYPYISIGAIIIATVSFIDDVRGLSPILRLIVHFFCAGLMIMQVDSTMSADFPFWLNVIIAVTAVALINAFNFLDGIKGMTACYGLVVLISAYSQFSESLLIMLIGAVIAFCFYNIRTPERCFAGDTGSISLGYFTTFALLLGAVSPSVSSVVPDWSVLIYVSVYLADFSLTLFRRIINRENIFAPHRTHLYQQLVDKCHISHIKVALCYATLQFAISIAYHYTPSQYHSTAFIITVTLLILLYMALRKTVIKVK